MADFLLNVREKGKVARDEFIQKCIEDPSTFDKPIKRIKNYTFALEEEHCPLNIAEEHLPYTSSQPAILDVSQCEIPIAEEDTTLEQTVPTKTHVSPSSVLRPYPRVSQDPTSMLPRKNNRSGRSRVLTEIPEDQIEA
ncbi:hypothetical protein DAPPUDRAFT_106666 [Daphnia pulex]|uniref:Uncharacterized protein n=1 Tax=Daphnia pulex TaxID=6669 RepID=E9GUP4_DAPPU|nr:hypothetical protein DAPPUDRAFT_106666 [Daphnia pulex]|eukprot:EFX76905.1 hypothetical protein DAPPUDRAFT_106666 [Daphnia pulex]